MKVAIYLGHPAHYHLFKHAISRLKLNGHQLLIFSKTKDILEDLLQRDGVEYTNILPEGRKDNKLAILWGILKRTWRISKSLRNQKVDLILGTDASITHAGRLLGIPSIITQEDDANVVPAFSYLAYPFVNYILAPQVCDIGAWKKKKLAYDGYHELAYLHPNTFTPDKTRISQSIDVSRPFYILRFAQLNAHHDVGRHGLNIEVVDQLIKRLKPRGNIYITSERELEPQFERYRITIDPSDMHDALYYADLYIGDSQTMAAEAAVLGTPSIRFNDFVGELAYLEELEHTYQLTFGYRTNNLEGFLDKIDEILSNPESKTIWQTRQKKMLKEKIDLTAFLMWFIEDYPNSVHQFVSDPAFQKKFMG